MPSQAAVSSGSGVTLTSGVDTNVLQQLVQPGTYLVWGQVNYAMTAATMTQFETGLSLDSAKMSTQAGGGGLGTDPVITTPLMFSLLTDTMSQQCGPTVLTLTAAATLYLVAEATFSMGTVSASGTLSALLIVGAGHNLIIS
jgi:hypothetical protein